MTSRELRAATSVAEKQDVERAIRRSQAASNARKVGHEASSLTPSRIAENSSRVLRTTTLPELAEASRRITISLSLVPRGSLGRTSG